MNNLTSYLQIIHETCSKYSDKKNYDHFMGLALKGLSKFKQTN